MFQGPMMGVAGSQALRDYHGQQDLASLAHKIALEGQQAQMQQYKDEEELRKALRKAGIEQAPLETISKRLANEKAAMDVTPAAKAAKESGFQTQVSEDKLKRMSNAFDTLDPEMLAGPAGVANLEKWADDNGVNKESPIYQKMISAGPSMLPQAAKQLKEKFMMNMATQREMTKKRAEQEYSRGTQYGVANIYANATKAAAANRNQSAPAMEFQLRQHVSRLPADPTQWTPEDKAALAQYDALVQENVQKEVSKIRQSIKMQEIMVPQMGAKLRAGERQMVEQAAQDVISYQPPAYQAYKKMNEKRTPAPSNDPMGLRRNVAPTNRDSGIIGK